MRKILLLSGLKLKIIITMEDKKMPKNLKPEHIKKKKHRIHGFSEKIIRIIDIYTLIAKDRKPTINQLINKYEVTERTIYRYLRIIDNIDKIERDQNSGGYKFTNSNRIKKFIISNDQIGFLMAVGEMSRHLGKSFEENFKRLVDSIAESVENKNLSSPVPFTIKIPDVIRSDAFNTNYEAIVNSIREQNSIDIVYHALHSNEKTERRIDPYGLIFYEGAWLVNAYCHLREEIRNFAIDRILKLENTHLHFQKKQGCDLEEECRHSWGIYQDDDVEVTLRFSKDVAKYITRRDKWHPTEQRTVLSSGEVELKLTVAGIDEIKRWIYSWLPNVVVVEPVWFRKQVYDEVNEAKKKHK